MRILCISPIFPPMVNAEALVSAKMVSALTVRGHDVTVLYEPGALGKDAPKHDTSPLWDFVRSCAVAVDAPGGVNPLATLWYGLKYRSYRIYPRWIRRTVRVARRLHRQKHFDVVYSRSLPMRAHIVGYWCARRLDVPWVLNVNDPWDLHVFPTPMLGEARSRLKRVVSDYWLRKALREADVVTFPCRRLGEYHLRRAGVTREFEVIPHVGMTLPARAAGGTGERPGEFRLVHAGLLGLFPGLATGRSSSGLLKGLAAFLQRRPEARPTTTLALIGPDYPEGVRQVQAMALSDVVRSTGRLNYDESLRRIAEATVCVLVEEQMSEGIYLPSKLADYVTAGKHVLALSPETGTLADLTPETGLTRVGPADDEAVADAIETLYDDHVSGRLNARGPSAGLVALFSPSRVAERFATAVESMRTRKYIFDVWGVPGPGNRDERAVASRPGPDGIGRGKPSPENLHR